jgi:hypothetical protein
MYNFIHKIWFQNFEKLIYFKSLMAQKNSIAMASTSIEGI